MEIQGPNPSCPSIAPIGQTLVRAISASPKGSVFRTAVGYISESGVAQLRAPLETLIQRAGTAEIIVGINELTSSALAAVKILVGICGETGVYGFYSRRRMVTFHPKVYTLTTPSGKMRIWIGSSNFTGAGLAGNYECNFRFDLATARPNSVVDDIECFFANIRSQTCCRAMTPDLLDELSRLRLPQTEMPARELDTDITSRLGKLFGPGNNRRPRISRDAFVMTLSKNDVAGTRGEPYFLVPVAARDKKPGFWGWPYASSKKGSFSN